VPWILPVVIGLVLSAPLAVLSSRRNVGLAARRFRVFVTPEEGAVSAAPDMSEARRR
jgi:membrane glycosyltransferase